MDCCQLEGCERNFDQKKAAAKLDKYRTQGPHKTTRMLVNALVARGVDDQTLLDIGGGIGALQHELLGAGVRSAIDFEASAAYIDACKDEAQRRGHADRITHRHGDFAEFGADIPPADIVTLERVICCYPDMPDLVRESCARTRRLLGLVIPYDVWWVKVLIELIYNFKFRVKRNSFRVFLHPTRVIDALIREQGLERQYYDRTGAWQVLVYERTGTAV
jgi:magnesium-protoporphyrin O-methyltransferase